MQHLLVASFSNDTLYNSYLQLLNFDPKNVMKCLIAAYRSN